jgi:predicted dehydrogenase
MDPRITFAIVGCGGVARKHAQTLATQVPGARLAAVCDTNPARADEFASRFGVPAFHGITPMMRALGDSLHVVNVLTPSGYHAANVLELLDHGCKNVVVEKPMALTLEDAEEMIDKCGEAEARLFVVSQNRFNRPVQALHQALRAGRFGKLVSGTIRMRWCRPQRYYDESAWRGTWGLDGGVFANQAYHHLDLLTWLMGEADTLFAYTARQLANIECEDTGVAVLRFRNGAVGVIEATTATRPRDLEGSVSILGEHGAVVIGGFAADRLDTWEFAEPCPQDEVVRRDWALNPAGVQGYAHATYLGEVVRCVREDRPATVGGGDGLNCLRLIHGLYESSQAGSEIHLPTFVPSCSRLGKWKVDAGKAPATALARPHAASLLRPAAKK